MTLTKVGTNWAQTREGMNGLRRRLANAGYSISFAYVVEPNRDGSLHVHALVHGAHLPDVAQLSEHAQASGMGWRADLRSWDGSPGLYLLKMAMAPETLVQFLELNGGRFVHATRDFWRTPEGTKLSGMDAAIRESRRRWFRRTVAAADTSGGGVAHGKDVHGL